MCAFKSASTSKRITFSKWNGHNKVFALRRKISESQKIKVTGHNAQITSTVHVKLTNSKLSPKNPKCDLWPSMLAIWFKRRSEPWRFDLNRLYSNSLSWNVNKLVLECRLDHRDFCSTILRELLNARPPCRRLWIMCHTLRWHFRPEYVFLFSWTCFRRLQESKLSWNWMCILENKWQVCVKAIYMSKYPAPAYLMGRKT